MMGHQPSVYALRARVHLACGDLGSSRSLRTSSEHVFYVIMFFGQDRPQSEGRRHVDHTESSYRRKVGYPCRTHNGLTPTQMSTKA